MATRTNDILRQRRRLGAEVILEAIVILSSVLKHEAVSLGIVRYIFANGNIMAAVDDDAALITLPDYRLYLRKCPPK